MSDTQKTVNTASSWLTGATFLLFLYLRLTDQIDWAWYWVAAPLWMPLAAVLAVLAVLFPILGVQTYFYNRRVKRRRAERAAKNAEFEQRLRSTIRSAKEN